MALSPDELERYARHIVMPEVGGPGKPSSSIREVLVIGAGALGAGAALSAAAGMAPLALRQRHGGLSNLQRQVGPYNCAGGRI
jgi:molybdopterin/thiamine biosynthesis adenylyltransferase